MKLCVLLYYPMHTKLCVLHKYIHFYGFNERQKHSLKQNYAIRNTEKIVPRINILSFKQIGTHGNRNKCHSSARSIAYRSHRFLQLP